MRPGKIIGVGLILMLIVLVGIGLWQTAGARTNGRIAIVCQPQAVMGTTCTLAAVVPYQRRARAEQTLRRAETALRTIEVRMSTWLTDSEISRFNAAQPDEEVHLSAGSLEILRAAKEAWTQTGGAFDVTCRPLIELWRRAGDEGVLPTESEMSGARAASNWKLIELRETGAVKRAAGAGVDLGGIAKGYAIDRAIEVLRSGEVAGGMVDVGGDLACFGRQPDARLWPVDVKSPFGSGRLAQLRGKRYSHIIDPRTGRPAEAAQSATVVAPSAMAADIWATALSVLGREGLSRLPENVEALIVVGSQHDCEIICTAGMRDLLEEPLPEPLTVW